MLFIAQISSLEPAKYNKKLSSLRIIILYYIRPKSIYIDTQN